MQAITQYLKNQGFNTVDDSYYTHISTWLKWYKGFVDAFHKYRQYNGKKNVNRVRKTLGMAKTVSEDWASLVLNEKVEIVINDNDVGKAVQKALDDNDFRVRGNQLAEITFALGTGAFVEYTDTSGKVIIDYIRAGMIYPLSWENGKIKECAFASETTQGKQKKVYLNIHRLESNGEYIVENKMFVKNGNNLSLTDLPEGVAEEIITGSDIPRFQIIKPNIVNNVDLDSPMGISVYANAVDQLEGCDLVYDSYCNEFRLGKKRILIPMTMARIKIEEDGGANPVFDDNDTEFYAVETGRDSEQKIKDMNMEIRADAHDKGMNKFLALLSHKCGMGANRYRFESGGIKTATEVISEDSDLYQSLKKHELIFESALFDMTKAIASLLGKDTEFEVTVNFDDSIIEDTNAEKQRFLQEITSGVRQKWEYRVRFFGEDEETAKSMIETSNEESWFEE